MTIPSLPGICTGARRRRYFNPHRAGGRRLTAIVPLLTLPVDGSVEPTPGPMRRMPTEVLGDAHDTTISGSTNRGLPDDGVDLAPPRPRATRGPLRRPASKL